MVVTYQSNLKKQQLVKDLQQKNKQYLIAKRKSEEFTKSKAKFYATVSHELRTPLYGVIGLSSILLENKELKKHKKDLKSLKFSANYLLALVNDLLHINKIESEGFVEENIHFNLKDLVSIIISSFEYIRIQHKNTIHVKIAKNAPIVLKGNSVSLSQILMNLIGNACKFTEKGSINLEVDLLSINNDIAKLQFIVRDTGPGIEKNKIDQIFNEFTQIETLSSTYQGTGLGLPIVKKLVEKANGNITANSEIGKGTTFKFIIDIAISSESQIQTSVPVLDFEKLDGKKILIVEDNRINQTVTKRILESSNVTCDIAQNGEEAIQKVSKSYFDLILMDINMPIKNGIDATKEIRMFNKTIPIIALTAVEIEEQRHQIFESGMDDIILKPYDIDRFKNTITQNLSTKPREELKKLG